MMTKRKLFRIIKILFYSTIIFNFSFLNFNCSRRFEPEPLALSVKQNLSFLQSDAQFVMYFNFKKMRETDFWKQFISDSIFNSEKNFGSFLYTLKNATGASISNGIDELYFSNSWLGDNAMLIKGTFDRNKISSYVNSDTNYSKLSYPNNIIVYTYIPAHFYFYFKDDFTVCTSNYLNQIENTLNITDTSHAGLLKNDDAMKIIEQIRYKDNLWMMSNQKLFIRGIFENFAEMKKEGSNKIPGNRPTDTLSNVDTTSENELSLASFYKNLNAVSFSIKMTDAIEIVMQNYCNDENSANQLKSRAEAIITLAKLSAQFSKQKSTPILKLLDKVDIKNFDNILVLNAKLEPQQIEELRKQKIF